MKIRPVSQKDNNYDVCGNQAIAVIEWNNTTIPLCEYCVADLTTSLEKFNNTIFCYKCKHFVSSEECNHSSTCLKRERVYEFDYDYIEEIGRDKIYCVNCMDTCKFAEKIKTINDIKKEFETCNDDKMKESLRKEYNDMLPDRERAAILIFESLCKDKHDIYRFNKGVNGLEHNWKEPVHMYCLNKAEELLTTTFKGDYNELVESILMHHSMGWKLSKIS